GRFGGARRGLVPARQARAEKHDGPDGALLARARLRDLALQFSPRVRKLGPHAIRVGQRVLDPRRAREQGAQPQMHRAGSRIDELGERHVQSFGEQLRRAETRTRASGLDERDETFAEVATRELRLRDARGLPQLTQTHSESWIDWSLCALAHDALSPHY